METMFHAFFKMLVGIIIFVGVPFLGWGIGDLGSFFAHPARILYVPIIVLMQLFVVIKMPAVGERREKTIKMKQRERFVLILLQIIPLAIVALAPYSDRHELAVFDSATLIRYLGLVMLCCGFLIMNRAEALLDKQFSVQVVIREGHRLVTDGLYRYLRHPRYMGILVFGMGISLVFRSWGTLVLVAALCPVLLRRIHNEEALLHKEFGAQWEAYAEKSWRLVPFVY